VALAGFNSCQDDEARIGFLYQRVYQRAPTPEEVKLGMEFIAQMPAQESGASEDSVQQVSNDARKFRQKQFAKQQQYRRGGKGGGEFQKRAPLKSWEEYTHALLQANEFSFVN